MIAGIAGDVAAERAEALGQRALDDVDARHDAVALGDAAAARAVKADGMDLVHIGHRVVAFGEIGDRIDRGDVAVHRIKALEDDQLGALAPGLGQQLFEMSEIVVAEHLALGLGAAHALDHRIVVELIGENEAIREDVADRRDRGEIRDPARGEDEPRLLAVQIGEFGLQLDERVTIAGNVAGAAGADAMRAAPRPSWPRSHPGGGPCRGNR